MTNNLENSYDEKEIHRKRLSKKLKDLKTDIINVNIDINNYSENYVGKIMHRRMINELIIERAELIKEYKDTRKELQQYLPPISDLVVDNTIFIVNFLHGGILDSYGTRFGTRPKYVNIPKTMNLFKLMSSDYSSPSCSSDNFITHVKQDILDSIILRTQKATRKNNINFMKKILKQLIHPVKNEMTRIKKFLTTNIRNKNYATNKRYRNSNLHIHRFLEDSTNRKIIHKEYQINLNKKEKDYGVFVITPLYPNIDLMDYIDINISDTFINFNTTTIFNLIKDIKYVLYLDFTCSGVKQMIEDFFKPLSGLNRFKQNAEIIEGKSITNNIETNNISYNANNEEIEMQHQNENIEMKRKKEKHLNRLRTTRKAYEVERLKKEEEAEIERLKKEEEERLIEEERYIAQLELQEILKRIKTLHKNKPDVVKHIEDIEKIIPKLDHSAILRLQTTWKPVDI
jgi:hypothetical protein